MQRKHKPRVLVIVEEDFKKRVQVKAIQENKVLSDVIRELLKKWLEE